MIVSSGYNIAAPEVEAALASHDAVTESAVIGVPDIERGTVIKAFVVLRRGRQPCDALAHELQDHVKSVIAPYKYPRLVEFVADLPRTPTGKIRHADLHRSKGGPASKNRHSAHSQLIKSETQRVG